MKLTLSKYSNYYLLNITYSDGDIFSFRSEDLDRMLACYNLLGFDDTYAITHEFMEKYNQYRKGETA